MLGSVLIFALLGSTLAVDRVTKLTTSCQVEVTVTYPDDTTGTPTAECLPSCDALESGYIQQRMFYREDKLDDDFGMMVQILHNGDNVVSCELVFTATDEQIRQKENALTGDLGCHPTFITPKAENPCEEGFFYVQELAKCYKLSDYTAQWFDSQCECASEGATLAIVNSAEEQAILAAVLEESVWIGLSDEEVEGTFEWRNGQPVEYDNWGQNEPSGMKDGDCVSMEADAGFTWKEEKCSAQKKFLCEPVKELETIVTCATGWEYREETGNCYKVTSTKQNWEESEETCSKLGGELITFKEKAELDAVKDMVPSTVWIGLNDFYAENTFVWTDGTALNFKNWMNNEPNDYNHWLSSFRGEDCVEMRSSGLWNDNNCGKDMNAMCKKESETFPRTTCPLGWAEFKSRCYRFYNMEFEYKDARDVCTREVQGGVLSAPLSEAENTFIKDIKGSELIWIGYNDMKIEGQFINEEGTAVSYVNWEKNEPNNYFGEDCVYMEEYGRWNDKDCSKKYKFVCVTDKYRGSP